MMTVAYWYKQRKVIFWKMGKNAAKCFMMTVVYCYKQNKSYLGWKIGKSAAKLLMITVAWYKQRKVVWFRKWEKMPQNF